MKLLLLALCATLATADVSHILKNSGDREAQIIKQVLETNPDGVYYYEIETSNGIGFHEHGDLKKVGNEELLYKHGKGQYTSPEGEVVNFGYDADENGYRPTGSHIPTPPPIPEYILRSLEWIRTHPQPENERQ